MWMWKLSSSHGEGSVGRLVGKHHLTLGSQQCNKNSQERPSVYVRFVQMGASITPERS
jgi:hypothetical protein